MKGKQIGIIGLAGIILANPLAVMAMSTNQTSIPLEVSTAPNQNTEVISEGIDKTTKLVVSEGAVTLTKNSDSVGEVTSNEITESLSSIVGLKEESANIETTSDTENAVMTETEGSSVSIPRDSSEAIVMESEGVALEITLPKTEEAEQATDIANGVVAYASQSDFANAVQATEDGGVRMTTVIDNPNAPTEYTYEIGVEGGYVLTEAINEDGQKGVIVLSEDQSEIISIIDAPWAKDANGNDVATHFEIRDNVLVQVVEHNVPGVVYPVTADPYIERFWWGNKLWLHRKESRLYANGITIASIVGQTIPGWNILSGLNAFWAQNVVASGKCIGITQYFSGPVWMWEWKNRHCK